jgi:cytochrome P450
MVAKLPPGPENRGIIGNFPMRSKDPLGVFRGWAEQYGDMFYYRVLHRKIFFLNHPDLVKQVLVNDPLNFIKGDALRNNRRIFGNGLLTAEGAAWRKQRRQIQPAFHHERIVAYGEAMVAHAERMMAAWQDGEARDIHDEMMRLTLEIVAEELFEVELAAERDRFSTAVNTLLELSSGGRMLLPPLLRMVPTRGNVAYYRAARKLDEIVYALIRKQRAGGSGSRGLLPALLQARDENGQPMPDEQVRDEVMTLLLAGHETTAVALSWTWYLLSRHPEVEQKLWAELREVLNGRDPGPGDLAALPYAERVVKEAIRLYPPIWAMVRNPIKDCEIGGYRVPAGSAVLMSQWVMHRDARFFAKPDQFDPDRWTDAGARGIPKFAYFPFGGGPRSCIGSAFAMMEAVLILTTVAQRYQVRLAAGFVAEPMPTITLRPKGGIQAVLVLR